LRHLLKDYRSEWSGIYERSERYITKELGSDLEIEEAVIAIGQKTVCERFEIKIVYGKQFTFTYYIKERVLYVHAKNIFINSLKR
jgi:hypothetical protein